MKPGYKQTEVGVIPEEWAFEPLAAHALSSAYGPRFSGERYDQQGNIALLRTTDLDDEGNLFLAQMPRARLPLEQFKSHLLQPGDFLVSRSGTCGLATVFPGFEIPVLPGAFLIRVRFGSGVDAGYLKVYFNSEFGKRHLQRLTEGGVQKNIRGSALVELRFPFPSADEQRAIAEALSDADALLGALDRLIVKKRDLKLAAMQQLLTGQTRLPGFHGEWDERPLGLVGACIRGVSYKGDVDLAPYDTTHTRRLLRSNNVQNATVVTSDIQFVSAARVSARQVLRADDILICMANGSKALVGKAGRFRVNDGFDYTFGAFMGCFRSDPAAAHPAFVFYLFQTASYRNYINNLLAGSSINNLRPSSVESLEFRFPGMPEQAAIAEAMAEMDAELALLEQRRDKTRALKLGMMQELLTGRIRLV